MMKILIVEDEVKTGSYLKVGLAESGFVVDHEKDGAYGFQAAMTGQYDLLILDVMLPTMNGWQIITGIRAAGLNIPVLFLTARDQVEDRVHGLELGADDYLVKPFAFSELLARVRTLLRRSQNATPETVLKVADLELDLVKRRVMRAGQKLQISSPCYCQGLSARSVCWP